MRQNYLGGLFIDNIYFYASVSRNLLILRAQILLGQKKSISKE